MIVKVLRAGAGITQFLVEMQPEDSVFCLHRRKLLHQNSLQPSAEISNQYFEESFICQVLKLSSHKYFQISTADKDRQLSQLPLSPKRFPFSCVEVCGSFLNSYLIIEKVSREFCQLVLWVLIAHNSKQKIPALTCFHNTNIKLCTAHR